MKTKKNKLKKVTITFGSTTVVAQPLSKAERQRNIKEGQRALARCLKALLKPGVNIKLPSYVPVYRADPEKRGHIIRELNGKCESGVIKNGKFKPIR